MENAISFLILSKFNKFNNFNVGAVNAVQKEFV